MKPQKQLTENDCLRACVATLIDYNIAKVPNFVEAPEIEGQKYPGWWLGLQSWLNELGLYFLEIQMPENFPWHPLPLPALAIFFGETEKGIKHAIVGKVEDDKFIPVFNPHPDAGRLKSITGLGFILPRDPVSYVRMGHCLSKIERLTRPEGSKLSYDRGIIVEEVNHLAGLALQDEKGFSLNGKEV